MEQDYRLRLPAPTEVLERVRRAVAYPVVNHCGPEFRDRLLMFIARNVRVWGLSAQDLWCSQSSLKYKINVLIYILLANIKILILPC